MKQQLNFPRTELRAQNLLNDQIQKIQATLEGRKNVSLQIQQIDEKINRLKQQRKQVLEVYNSKVADFEELKSVVLQVTESYPQTAESARELLSYLQMLSQSSGQES